MRRWLTFGGLDEPCQQEAATSKRGAPSADVEVKGPGRFVSCSPTQFVEPEGRPVPRSYEFFLFVRDRFRRPLYGNRIGYHGGRLFRSRWGRLFGHRRRFFRCGRLFRCGWRRLFHSGRLFRCHRWRGRLVCRGGRRARSRRWCRATGRGYRRERRLRRRLAGSRGRFSACGCRGAIPRRGRGVGRSRAAVRRADPDLGGLARPGSRGARRRQALAHAS
jgi:hypothetical protein